MVLDHTSDKEIKSTYSKKTHRNVQKKTSIEIFFKNYLEENIPEYIKKLALKQMLTGA